MKHAANGKYGAVGITDGVCWADDGDGLGNPNTRHKTLRENPFPASVLDTAVTVKLEEGQASVESDRVHILNAIAGRKGEELELPPHASHEQ